MINLAEVRRIIVAHRPGYEVHSIARLGEGLDNVAYEVNGELIVRFSKDPARSLETEARLLAAVAGVCSLPVPEPIFTAEGCLAYAKLPGLPLLNVSSDQRAQHGSTTATAIGELLTALHELPADPWAGLVDTDDEPLESRLREAERTYATVREHISADHRPIVEEFLKTPPPPEPDVRVFSHNDLGIEHVLIDPLAGKITGIIDWSDAAITDPAHDFGLLYRDLGPEALRLALDAYNAEVHDIADLVIRAVFYARCGALEDLAYGMQTGKAVYAAKSLAAMRWLFLAG